MYESLTINEVLQSMLDLLTTNLDTREGSFTRDLLAAAAVEIWKGYQLDDTVLSTQFLEEVAGEVVDKRAAEYGLARKEGTKATAVLTITGADVLPEGTVVQTEEGLLFNVLEDGVTVEADEVGAAYNVEAGTINTLSVSIAGVTAITNAEAAAGGTDAESDDDLVDRILNLIQNPATSGNSNHYYQWAMNVNGVGNAKVYPLWNGNGTVKVLIVNGNMEPADDATVTAVSEAIEASRPIGATVTVASAASTTIKITATLQLDGTKTLTEVKEAFTASVTEYLHDIVFTDASVSLSKVGYLLLDTEGVSDYSSLKLNGKASNVTIADGNVPVIGEVTLS